ncbi:unnamed protein product [marine sediment metagenome]|uniref:Phenylalanine-tRNA ligase class II N-terminal domain-containing protein n=1 Tax=marine sediment metagenome TaxID=412755 RepID=X1HDV0_9ZZZZ
MGFTKEQLLELKKATIVRRIQAIKSEADFRAFVSTTGKAEMKTVIKEGYQEEADKIRENNKKTEALASELISEKSKIDNL